MNTSDVVTRLLMTMVMTIAKPRNKTWNGLSVFLSSFFLKSNCLAFGVSVLLNFQLILVRCAYHL